MKLFTVCVFLASIILGTAAWGAEPTAEPTAEHALITGANFALRLRNDQRVVCAQPRTNTSEKCRSVFEDALRYHIVFMAKYLPYLVAYHGNGGAREIRHLKAESDRVLKEVLERTNILDRDYLPLKTSEVIPKKK